MQQIDKQRFFTMAEAYDTMAPLLVPHYDFLQREAIAILCDGGRPLKCIVDLGAGSGRFLELALTRLPGLHACWVDYSEDFLAVARERLERFGDKVTYVVRNLEDRWEEEIDRPVDAVVSMSAIHHLVDADKARLYARCHGLLAPGGWVLNTDEVRARDDDAYLASLHRWVQHVAHQKERVPVNHAHLCARWVDHFAKWQERNVANFGGSKSRGDDLHAPVDTQLDWLREAGFHHVNLFVKYHLWAIIGGRKPL